MITVRSSQNIIFMSPDNEPAAYAAGGETVCFETLDSYAGQIKDESKKFSDIDYDLVNLATGPLYVKGAVPGDTLKVEILSIKLAEHAITIELPGADITGVEAKDERTKLMPIRNEQLVFNDKLLLPVRPMIGIIGTAPAHENILTGIPGSFGGNMDCKCIGENTTLYLPVNVEGALLSIGDLHAIMGDGEVCCSGAEAAGEVVIKVNVLKDSVLPVPFLKTEHMCMTIYSDRDIKDAAMGAVLSMRKFLIENIGMADYEAGMLLSLAGDLRICQIVNPSATCRIELNLDYLKPYGYQFP